MNAEMIVPSKHGITKLKLKCGELLGTYGTEYNCVKYVANKYNIDTNYSPEQSDSDRLKSAQEILSNFIKCNQSEADIGYVFIEIPHMFLYINGNIEVAATLKTKDSQNVHIAKGSLNNSFHNSLTTPILWFKYRSNK